MRRIDGLCVPAEVLKNPLDHRRILDAGDDPQPPAAAPAELDVDGEHPLEALRPGQSPLSVGGQWLAARLSLVGGGGASAGHDPGPIRARRREHAVIPRQVGAGFWHQRIENVMFSVPIPGALWPM